MTEALCTVESFLLFCGARLLVRHQNWLMNGKDSAAMKSFTVWWKARNFESAAESSMKYGIEV